MRKIAIALLFIAICFLALGIGVLVNNQLNSRALPQTGGNA
jgi:uncharacterized protein YoxC